MKMSIANSKCFLALAILTTAAMPRGAYCGLLGDFEADVAGEPKEQEKQEHHRRKKDKRHNDDKRHDNKWRNEQITEDSHGDDHDNHGCRGCNGLAHSLARTTVRLVGTAMYMGGEYSMARVGVASFEGDQSVPAREEGEFLLPYLRADAAYRRVRSDVVARDYQVEIGLGAFAAHYNTSRYKEDSTGDELDLSYLFGVYRMSSETVELDVGVGQMTLEGADETERLAFTSPLRIRVSDAVGLEFRPIWTSDVSDYDAAVHIGRKFVSAKLGYREAKTSNTSLNGPYIGISLRY